MFKTLRTGGGTMDYHRTKDILYVMKRLGHKNIKNTLIYIQLEEALFKDEIDYVSKLQRLRLRLVCLSRLALTTFAIFTGIKYSEKGSFNHDDKN